MPQLELLHIHSFVKFKAFHFIYYPKLYFIMRKGISAVLAVVLIVVITVAIIGLAYAWATGFFEMTTEASEAGAEAILQNLQKKVKITSARCDAVTIDDLIWNNITFTVKATGTADIEAGELVAILNDLQWGVNPAMNTVDFAAGDLKQFWGLTRQGGSIVFKIDAPAGPVEKEIDCPEIV